MSNPGQGVNIPITATVQGDKQVALLEGSIAALRQELTQAKKDFEAAAPKSAAWNDAAGRVVDLGTRLRDSIKPLEDMAAATERAARAAKDEAESLKRQAEAARDAAKAAELLAKAKRADSQSARADAVMAAQRQMAEDMRQSERATARLSEKLEEVKGKKEKVGKASSESARGVLELSRAFEDAQYGIAGVLNNLPNIIQMFGGGAGLAGVLSIAAVAATILFKRLDGANFDGTWIGDLKTSFNELVTGMSEAEREARKIAEAPPTWAKNAEQEFEAKSKLAEQALEREIELMKTKLEVQKSLNEQRALEVAHAEKLWKIQNPNLAPKGSPEWAAQETQAKQKEFQTREAERIAKVKGAEGEKNTTAAEAERLASEAAIARKNADQYRNRENLDKAAKQSETDRQAALRELQNLPTNKEGNIINRAREKELVETMAAQKRQADSYIAKRDALPAPAAGDDAGKAAERAKAAEEIARKAGEDAAKEAREFEAAKATSRREREINEAQLKRDRDDISGAQFDKISKDQEEARKAEIDSRNGKGREVFTPPTQGLTPPSPMGQPLTTPIGDQVAQANNQLNGLAERAGDGQTQAKIGGLYSAVNDGKGDTSKELDVIREFAGRIGGNAEQNKAALDQALSKMEALQTDGSRMQQTLANLMEGLIGNQRALAAMLQGMAGEVSNVKQQIDSIRR